MTSDWLQRQEMLLGHEICDGLSKIHIVVVGLGGVGGFASECLARCGVGMLTIVDGDKVESTNRNRQLVATSSTQGTYKTLVLKARLTDINPEIRIRVISNYLKEEEMPSLVAGKPDYVLDCIDTLSPKVALIQTCLHAGVPIVSSLGAGGKFDPERIQITDISRSHQCTLAKTLRKRLHSVGIRSGFKVVFSPEPVDKAKVVATDGSRNKKSVIGTISWMPPLFGAYCASVAVRDIIANLSSKV